MRQERERVLVRAGWWLLFGAAYTLLMATCAGWL